jgi:hypothetical protein
VLAGGVLVLLGCEEPLGPLSPQTVDAITKTQGDAQGFDRSGSYSVEVDLVECPCEEAMAVGRPAGSGMVAGLTAFSLCEALRHNPTSIFRLDVLATDGVVTFVAQEAAAGAELIGPLYEGGAFSAGAVTSITSFAAEGRLVTRLDGDFDRADPGHEFEATLVNRIAGRTTLDTQAIHVDCTEHIELAGASN